MRVRRIELDGARMTDRAEAHDYLARRLALPEYYGRNLDALYDCLSSGMEDTEIELQNADALVEALGAYGGLLLRVMEDAAAENTALRVCIWPKYPHGAD